MATPDLYVNIVVGRRSRHIVVHLHGMVEGSTSSVFRGHLYEIVVSKHTKQINEAHQLEGCAGKWNGMGGEENHQ